MSDPRHLRSSAALLSSGPGVDVQPAWFQDAVFYELPVKAFYDADADGVGDFAGLTRKLDYVAELGATCLWLLPFYPSPLLDDGYDVSDFRDVHPRRGTMSDFRAFVAAAHARGLKVAAEVVVNHTSDRHPWFEAARAAPPGSPPREFYVWSDTPDRFRDAPVLYADAKRSNWSWDAEARAFYFHRFYPHQPDLNYANPLVRAEMLKVLRFWAEAGVDGLCLNGAAYLAEEEGTSCEGLPQTHAALREFRRELAAAYPHLMLQAGVVGGPAEVAAYFGAGDECNAAPNLALAARLFQAVRQEDRYPVADILRQTPDPPPGCQWVTLLRHHDELTLTGATDEERDFLLREYAADPRTRLHHGILRRLAPLADNDRRKIELLFGLLLALPGAPKIYYGDELGTGDNVFLGGREAVRTPMPWSADRNAGFSAADPARLYAPPVSDPVFGYQAVNVEAERRDPSSLFHWLRRHVALRKRFPVFARGKLELLDADNRKVLAFLRVMGDEVILVVANLARTAQPAELDLADFAGMYPVEMLGGAAFHRIGAQPYPVMLGPYGFRWFRLRRQPEEVAARLAPVQTEEVGALPSVDVPDDDWPKLLDGPAREWIERGVLPGYLRSQRWFGGKSRAIAGVRIADWGPFPVPGATAFLALIEVTFAEGGRDLYFLPLAVSTGAAAPRLLESARPLVLARLAGPHSDALLHDALTEPAFCTALLDAVAGGEKFPTRDAAVRWKPTTAFAQLRGDPGYPLPVVRGPATSSNSLLFYGRRLLLKLFRRLEEGINPDFEVGRFLTERTSFDRIPRVAGSLVREAGDSLYTLGILQALVPNQGDGWAHAIDELGRYYDRATARMFGPDPVPPDARPLPELAESAPPPAALETIDGYLHSAATLGRRTAQMHLALASDATDPAFAPEPLADADMGGIRAETLAQARRALEALAANLSRLPEEVAAPARGLLDNRAAVLDRLARERGAVPQAVKTRIHGDYHLGQVLWAGGDYVVIDFEGEPTRTVEERRAKFSPVRDVAGMLRSYHYAAFAGLFAYAKDRPGDFGRLRPWADLWFQWVSAAFLRAYLHAAGGAPFLPRDRAAFAELLDRFTLAKALYELAYELNNRPDWVRIPLGGVLRLLGERPA
jgi:maltose alpha-D-glucosyltransferase/alpha-amylase